MTGWLKPHSGLAVVQRQGLVKSCDTMTTGAACASVFPVPVGLSPVSESERLLSVAHEFMRPNILYNLA